MYGEINDSKVKVEIFLASPTVSSYQNMCSRSFQINMNDTKVQDNLANVFGTIREQASKNDRGGWIENVSTNVVNNNLNGLITSSNIASVKSEIPNGWDSRRYTFIMKIHTLKDGLELMSVVEGYSDHYDPSLNNMVDFNLNYNINKITNYNKAISATGDVTYSLENSYNLLADPTADNSVSNLLGGTIGDKSLTRPIDIHNAITNEYSYGANNIVLNSSADYSNKSNIVAVGEASKDVHMSKVLNDLLSTKNDPGAGDSTADIMFNTAMKSSKLKHINTPFIMMLKHATRKLNVNSFTLAELALLDPSLNDSSNTAIKMGSEGGIVDNSKENNMMNLANPNGSSFESVISSDIRNKFTQICSLYGYEALSLSFANYNRMEPTFTILPGSTPLDTVIKDELKIKKHIIEELLPSISKDGVVTVDVIVQYERLGNTIVTVSIEGKPAVPTPFPEFGSSLYSSIITTKTEAAKLTDDYNKLFDLTYDASTVDMNIDINNLDNLDEIGNGMSLGGDGIVMDDLDNLDNLTPLNL